MLCCPNRTVVFAPPSSDLELNLTAPEHLPWVMEPRSQNKVEDTVFFQTAIGKTTHGIQAN